MSIQYYNFIQLIITNMNIIQKQQPLTIKIPFRNISALIKNKKYPQVQQHKQQNHDVNDDEDSVTISMPSNRQPPIRVINKSMINRSCMNTCNFSLKNIQQIPNDFLQMSHHKFSSLQKIDFSFNNIADIQSLPFDKMISLKELIVNNNQINQIPHHLINNCPQLIFLNFDNNQLTLIPTLKHVRYLLANNNNIKLITSQLIELQQIQFITFDWLDYLIDVNQIVSTQHQKIKEYTSQYQLFKKNILSNIDYSKQENNNYCDFNCYFLVRINKNKDNKFNQSIFSILIGRSIIKSDQFFLQYLKHFHNDINFAKMTYNSHLLLELALQSNKKIALQIFMLRKVNYAQLIDQQTYFQSLRLSCIYSCYQFFKYLICIRSRKSFLMNRINIESLIKLIMERFDKQKQGDKILIQLIRLWTEITNQKIVLTLPATYNSKVFKSLSYSLLQIYSNHQLNNNFSIESQVRKTTPLHFAMRSKNQQLIQNLLSNQNHNIFEKNYCGLSSKFIYGSTQISRKMVWNKQKQLIQKHWKDVRSSSKNSLLSSVTSRSKISSSQISSYKNNKSRSNLQQYLKNRIAYQDFKSSLHFYKKPNELSEQISKRSKRNSRFINKRNTKFQKLTKKDEIGKYLTYYHKLYKDLNFHSNYKKKITYQDVLENLLLLIPLQQQDQFMLKIQKSQKMIDILMQMIDTLSHQQQLLKYEMMQTIFMLLGNDQAQKNKNIVDVNFWCCQNVNYQ